MRIGRVLANLPHTAKPLEVVKALAEEFSRDTGSSSANMLTEYSRLAPTSGVRLAEELTGVGARYPPGGTPSPWGNHCASDL